MLIAEFDDTAVLERKYRWRHGAASPGRPLSGR